MSERDEAVRRWRSGEERLYPIIMVRPDLYERCAMLVRSLTESLEGVPDLDALVATYRVGDVPTDFRRADIDPEDLPPEIDRDLVRDAAYNNRARQILVRAPVEEAARLIRRARSTGEATVVLWSEGQEERAPGYRRIEMAVATGRAVVRRTELDPDLFEPRFIVEAVQLDPETGEGVDDEPLAPPREFTDPERWRSAAGELRSSLLTDPEGAQ